MRPIVIDEISNWRNRFAEKILVLALIIFPVALAATFPYYLEQRLVLLIAIDLGALAWMLLVLLVRRPPLAPSGIAVMAPIAVFFLSFFITLGPEGARPLWIGLSVALAAALYGMRGVWITTGLCTLALGLLYALIPPSFPPWQHALAQPMTASLMTVVNINLLSLVLGAAVATVIKALETQIQKTKASSEKYRLLAENASDVIWTADKSLRFTYISPSIRELRGYTSEEATGAPLAESLNPSSVAKVVGPLARQVQLAEAGDPAAWDPLSFDAEQPHKDGQIIITSTHVKLVEGSDEVPISFVGVTRDVTMARKTEQRLRQAQKMEALGRLAGGVAHDFNNMLSAIVGNADLALADLAPEDPVRRSIEEISDAATRSALLTQQLLAFTRKQVAEPQVIDLNDLIRGMRPMLARLIGEDVALRALLDEPLGRVRVDPSQMEQIILNLAVNARDAMPDGGELLIETLDVDLDAASADTQVGAGGGARVMLAVSDTGCGMSAETKEKIFEPFFTTKDQGVGTGLGLTTILGIVEQNDGTIKVYSEPGRGSTFKIFFRRVDGAHVVIDCTEGAALSGGDETVLVVDDEEAVRAVAEKLLTRLGYCVLVATDGEDAIRLAETHRGTIDLLFTDVVMPKMNGRELADKLIETYPGLKVLYTSGYTADVMVDHGVIDDEGLEFIAKPYTLTSLAVGVRKALNAR